MRGKVVTGVTEVALQVTVGRREVRRKERAQEGPEVGTGKTRGEVVWGKSVAEQIQAVGLPGMPGVGRLATCVFAGDGHEGGRPGEVSQAGAWTGEEALGLKL